MRRVTELFDYVRQFLDCNFNGITQIEDGRRIGIEFRRPNNTIHKVGNISETASLQSIPMNLHWFVSKNCRNENRLRPAPPAQMLPWPVTAKEPENRNRNTIASLVSERHVLVE